MHGKQLSGHTNGLKIGILIGAVVLAVLLVCLVVYWWLFAPWVSTFFRSEDCIYKGLKYYHYDAYLQFEDGNAFREVLTSFGATDKGEPVDFYYVDNYVEDNPLYGKMCDTYALDVYLPAEAYWAEKASIQNSAATWQTIDAFACYALPYGSVLSENVIAVAFCDQAQIARYIMITELDTTDGFYQVFLMRTNLEWTVPNETQKQGDGSLVSHSE